MESCGALVDVVVATDGSIDADLAVDWASREAMRRAASLLIISAYAPGDLACGSAAGLDIVDCAADRVRRQFPGLTIETKAVQGDPRDALAEYQDRAALVALGSRGLNRLRTVWLGSVSYWAARHLTAPVAIVRPPRGGHPTHRHIAVGVDRPSAEGTLRAAFDMAAHSRCALTVGHAWWDVEAPGERWSPVEAAAVESTRRHMVNEMVKRVGADFPDVEANVTYARGSVTAFLLDLARSHEALFIGRRRTAPFDTSGLGTVASAVVEHAYGATVVVPAAPRTIGRR